MKMPPVVRPGGPVTDTHGQLGIKVELGDKPHIMGFQPAWVESVRYGFEEDEQHLSRTGGWAFGATGGAAFNTGTAALNSADFALNLSFGSREQRWGNAIQQNMTREEALNRSVDW